MARWVIMINADHFFFHPHPTHVHLCSLLLYFYHPYTPSKAIPRGRELPIHHSPVRIPTASPERASNRIVRVYERILSLESQIPPAPQVVTLNCCHPTFVVATCHLIFQLDTWISIYLPLYAYPWRIAQHSAVRITIIERTTYTHRRARS